MLARTSVRELFHRPLRTCLAALGVAVATAMLVDMLMLGSGIQQSFASLLEARGYELRISPKGTLPFDTEARIPSFSGLQDTILTEAGISGVGPVLAASVAIDQMPDSELGSVTPSSIQAVAFGVDPAEQGLFRLLEGDLPSSGEVLLDRRAATTLEVSIGETIQVRGSGALGVAIRSVGLEVSGLADFVFASREESPIALELEDLQRLTGRTDEISFAMVRLTEGADPELVRSALARSVSRAEIVSVSGVVEEANKRLSYFRQLALILGSVSLIVAALLVGTLMAVSISERIGTITAVRAIGVPRAQIIGGLTAESLLLCALSGAIGLGLGVVVAGYLESILSDFPGLPQAVQFFVLRPKVLIQAYSLLLVVGGLAALVPAWRATQLEIASTLHSEAP